MTDSKQRRVASLEALILHPSTGEHERAAAVGRWEAITGQKWTGKKHNPYGNHEKAHSNPSGGQQRQQQQTYRQQTRNGMNWDDFADQFRRAAGGFGGFGGFGDDDDDSFAGFAEQARQRANQRAKDYDFSHNTCTQKQYEYVKAISDFFRWKCPDRNNMEFEEAQDFLNRYSELFKMFSPYGRNFSNLKKLFEAFGIDWNQTRRTFKWKAFHE